MSDKIKLTITIPDELTGLRVDQALAKCLPDYSRTLIKQWILAGYVTYQQQTIQAKTKLIGGEIIEIDATRPDPIRYEAEPIPLDILYEDESLLVINKPIGLVVHPGAGNREHTLLNALLHKVPTLKDLPRAGILHRLDKDTSGALLVAKTQKALRHLTHQLKKRQIIREYQAVVVGNIISGGTIEAPIARHPLNRIQMSVQPQGKNAITHYRVNEKFKHHTCLNVRIETGRTHQIRVHMAYIKHPIVGDQTYGGRLQLKKGMSEKLIQMLRQFKRQALHAHTIQFEHPETAEWMTITAPLPNDITLLLDCLRQD